MVTTRDRPGSRRGRLSAITTASLLISVLAPAAVAAAPPEADWSQFRHDPAHTGVATDETTLSPETVDGLRLAWWARTGFNSSPSVRDGVVTVGSGSGRINAYAADCGILGERCSPLWWGRAGWVVDWSSPAMTEDLVFIGAGGGLTAWDMRCAVDGSRCSRGWTGTSGDIGYSSPAIAEGLVAVGTNDGRLDVYDLAAVRASVLSGSCAAPGACGPLWTAGMGREVHTTPAIVDGVVYIGGRDGRLRAFDARCRTDGGACTPLWVGRTGSDIVNSSPTVADGVVYLGAQNGRLYAWPTGCATDGSVCQPLWTGQTPKRIQASPAVADGIVYIGSGDQRLYAFPVGCRSDGGACDPLWRSVRTGTGRGQMVSSPAVANGVVYVGSQGTDQADGRLWAFPAGCTPVDGVCRPLWRSPSTGAMINSSPAVVDGRVYIASNDGRLYAYALGGGDTQAPDVRSLDVRFAGRATFGEGDVVLRWSGTDRLSGIAAWRLQQQQAGGAWRQVPLASSLATQARLHVEPGVTTRFRVRAIDRAGNSSAWWTSSPVQTELIDDADVRVVLSPDAWTPQAGVLVDAALGGTLMGSETAGASATLDVEASGIALVAPRVPGYGKVDVLIDGVRVRTVDLGATDATRSRQVVFQATWPEVGAHTIGVVLRGTPGRPHVDLDAFWVMR
jgi:outer membrane protein assembly factor BamB